MLFPIWDDQVQGWVTPYITWLFISLNVLVFLYEASLWSWLDEFLLARGSIPTEILAGKDSITLITSLFLHGGWMHLLGNMMFLYVFGDNIEASVGHVKFLFFYLCWWIAAGLVHAWFNPSSLVPAVGASGAIAAVLWAYLVLFPTWRIKILYMRTMQTFLIPARQFLLYRIVLQFFSGVGELASSWLDGGVAWWAHIGWFAFWVGVVVSKLLRR